MTTSKRIRSDRPSVQRSKAKLKSKIKIPVLRNFAFALMRRENNFDSYQECNPIIPFKDGVDRNKVETYLLNKCKPWIKIHRKFHGKEVRINDLTGVGVMLDYIGCSIYDSIVYYNELLTDSEEGMYKSQDFSRNVVVFDKLREIFCGSYCAAYGILVD